MQKKFNIFEYDILWLKRLYEYMIGVNFGLNKLIY